MLQFAGHNPRAIKKDGTSEVAVTTLLTIE
jgi:hypothetical protein